MGLVSFLPSLLKSLSLGTPIIPMSFFLTPNPCSMLLFQALVMFDGREAASVLFSFFFPCSFCSLSDPLSHFPSLDIASIYIHV